MRIVKAWAKTKEKEYLDNFKADDGVNVIKDDCLWLLSLIEGNIGESSSKFKLSEYFLSSAAWMIEGDNERNKNFLAKPNDVPLNI